MKIYSEPGVGTTVRIYLPRLEGDAQAQGEAAENGFPVSERRARILVLEDDDAVRELSVETLKELGYEVLQAKDGPQALTMLKSCPDVDLLFTDVVLPGGMNGAQVAALAVAELPSLKVLFTTGYARNALVHQGRLDNGVHLLTKPFTFDALGRKVKEVLRPSDASGTAD